MKIVPGAYNCIYISSIRKGVQELNLTSGNLRNLLLMDETGEMVYSRDLLVNSDNELRMILIRCPIMPFIRCARIVKVASG